MDFLYYFWLVVGRHRATRGRSVVKNEKENENTKLNKSNIICFVWLGKLGKSLGVRGKSLVAIFQVDFHFMIFWDGSITVLSLGFLSAFLDLSVVHLFWAKQPWSFRSSLQARAREKKKRGPRSRPGPRGLVALPRAEPRGLEGQVHGLVLMTSKLSYRHTGGKSYSRTGT